MKLSEFKERLHTALLSRGIDGELADEYTDAFCAALTDADTANATETAIEELAADYACRIKKSRESAKNEPQNRGTDEKSAFTARNIAMIALITLVSSPLWAIAAVVFFAPFAAMFSAEIALTFALILLLACEAALGAASALTGIIYGVIKLFSVTPIGIYEIGFGIITGGVTMLVGILIYNAAVRLMPWLVRRTAALFRYAFTYVRSFLREYKRRCCEL